MDDEKIIELYWERNALAIDRTAEKYGNYCSTIARNILRNEEDSEECVNDTWLGAWNSIPPKRPKNLATFLGKLTAQKRLIAGGPNTGKSEAAARYRLRWMKSRKRSRQVAVRNRK